MVFHSSIGKIGSLQPGSLTLSMDFGEALPFYLREKIQLMGDYLARLTFPMKYVNPSFAVIFGPSLIIYFCDFYRIHPKVVIKLVM